MAEAWFRFPNGKVWRVDPASGAVRGMVVAHVFFGLEDHEEQLAFISEAVTGSPASLADFWAEPLGEGRLAFNGSVDLAPDNESETPVELAVGSKELRDALQAQYGLTDIEVTHALMNLGNEYGKECVLSTRESGRELRCPAFPEECTYVRVVIDGLELAYWIEDEWRDDPAVVMGAIFGAARAGV